MTCSAALPSCCAPAARLSGAPPALPASQGRASPCLLPAGRALTVRARRAGVLCIVQGRVWLTFSHAERSLKVRAGDHFLGAGQSLALARGDAVVLEPWCPGQGSGEQAPASFEWALAAAPGVRPDAQALALALHGLGRALADVAVAGAGLARAWLHAGRAAAPFFRPPSQPGWSASTTRPNQ